MARESSVLIGSAMSDERLRKALMEIEDLNKALETERTTYKQKVIIQYSSFYVRFITMNIRYQVVGSYSTLL